MSKNTFLVNGGAMPKIDRKAVMAAAWQIFRETYRYPSIPFRSIGRKCFGWALKEAWRRQKEAARLASIPADVKASRIAVLNDTIKFASFNESWAEASREIAAAKAEISQLVTSGAGA